MGCYKYNVLNKIKVEINIEENRFDIPLDRLLYMAARVNPKRSFLFVSRVLGKHQPIKPKDGLLIGAILAGLYHEGLNSKADEQLNQLIDLFNKDNVGYRELADSVYNRFSLKRDTLFIGFAETATALGHSVFSAFDNNAYYIHTTRENIVDLKKSITFEEEHSHATSHRVYPMEKSVIESECPVVLIDDEITTGKTLLNIIEAMHAKFPRKCYSVLTILDWRNKESIARFRELEERLDIEINVHSIVKGFINVDDREIKENPLTNKITQRIGSGEVNVSKYDVSDIYGDCILGDIGYLSCTGRFGLSSDDNKKLLSLVESTAERIRKDIKSRDVLCIGTEEFMFIPMAISAALDREVKYQSTTRSPIYPESKECYGATTADQIESFYNSDVVNYIYNIDVGQYDEAIVFVEKPVDASNGKLSKNLMKLGLKEIKTVNFI